MFKKRLTNNKIKINIDSDIYDYGITHKQVCEFVGRLRINTLILDEYTTVEIEGTSVRLFPYVDIYNNIIINISID